MTDRSLFDAIPAREMSRAADPATSKAAADSAAASGRASSQREAVLAAVRAAPGRTSDELAAGMGVGRHMVARRLPELERLGLVRRGEARASRVGGRAGLTWWPAEGGGT